MAQGASFVRVPPQSTGKRVATEERTQLAFDNQTQIITIGSVIDGQTSGAQGVVTAIVVEGFGANEGLLFLRDVSGTFQNNENLQVSAVTVAVANADTNPIETYDYAQNVLVDPDNPTHRQKIDRFGATVNTFTDGSPTFGAFGTLTVGEPQVIKDYRFAYNGEDDLFWDNTVGSGSISYETNPGLMMLSTSTGGTDLAQRTSHFYHPYAPGVGHSMEMTIRHGDVGKANNRRRWGYFDDDNGVFFELDGTNIYVVVRSNVSGSPVDTRYLQSDWNLDSLDGTDSIGFTLDITNPNIYFIDFQWLGAGRIRFGIVEPGGSRITAHLVENANQSGDYPYMRTATLPVRIENENTGAAGSTSEIRWACAAVKHASKVDITGARRTFSTGIKTVALASGEVPVYAIRPQLTYNGLTNRTIGRATSIDTANITNTGSGPVKIRIRVTTDADTALTGEAFTAVTGSAFEADDTATAINTAGMVELASFILLADSSELIVNNDPSSVHSWEINLGADGTTQQCIIVTAECMSGTSAGVIASVNWEEIIL